MRRLNHAELQYLTTEYPFKKQYDNFIGGKWVKPVGNEYYQQTKNLLVSYSDKPLGFF